MNPYVVRVLGVVAVVLGLVSIWVEFAPGGTTYWDGEGHAVGIAMLVLAILAAAGIAVAALTQLRFLDQLWLLPGLVLGGIALFLPLSALGNGNIDELKVGGWLGVAACGVFLVAGVLNAYPEGGFVVSAPPAAPAPATPPPPPESPAPG
jgi:hypothetical protein